MQIDFKIQKTYNKNTAKSWMDNKYLRKMRNKKGEITCRRKRKTGF